MSKAVYISFLSFITSVFIISCNSYQKQFQDGVDSIEIVNDYFLNTYCDSVDIVVLDSNTPEAVLGLVSKVLFDDNYFFISHKASQKDSDTKQFIEVFRKDGTYVCQIGRLGRAANEYQAFRGWTIDPNNKEVLIADMYRSRIMRFQYDGTYIDSYNYSDANEVNQLFYSGNELYVQVMIPTKTGIDDIAVLGKKGDVKTVIKDRKIKTEIFLMPGIKEMSDPNNDTLYHMRPFDNYLYVVSNGAISNKIDVPFIPTLSRKDTRRIKMDSHILNYSPSYVIDTKKYCFVSKQFDDVKMFVFEKNKNKWVGYTNKNSDMKIIMPARYIGTGGNNNLYGLIDASLANALLNSNKSISSEDVARLERISQSENPSLLIYHLK